jgi:hypothetical protein
VDHGFVQRGADLLSRCPRGPAHAGARPPAPRRARAFLAGVVVTAGVLAGGCGASGSPFAGTAHPPAGYVSYHGSDYVLAVPPRYQAKPASVPDQPPGSTVTSLTQSGAPPAKTNAEILILQNPHLSLSLDQVVSNLEREDQTNPSISHAQVGARTAAVPGSKAARIVTERYVAPDSPTNPAPVTFDRTWLMVLVRPGVLLDVIVADAPKLGGRLDADAVIDSFRLEQ